MLAHGRNGPLTVAIVGAGRVGCTLGRGLRAAGWRVGAVVTRRASTARKAVRAIGDGQPHGELVPQLVAADLLLVCVPDAEISGVAERLAELGGKGWRGRIVLHASGRLDSRALRPLGECSAATGSLHPVQVFNRRGVTPLEGCFFEIEGSATALRAARRVCRDLRGVPVRVPTGGKCALHAARSFVSPFLVASFEAATRILMARGFTRRQATRMLEPLARRALESLLRLGPKASPGATARAWGLDRVERDAKALDDFPQPYHDAYVALWRLRAELGQSSARKKSSRRRRRAIENTAVESKHLGGRNVERTAHSH